MTRKGAQMVIESLSMRIFEIQEARERLAKEEQQHRDRILELEKVSDDIVVPQRIVVVE